MVDSRVRFVRASRTAAPLIRVATASLVQRVVLLYLISRIVTTALFLLVGAGSLPGSVPGPGSGLGAMLTAWDGGWYRQIGTGSYPTVLPEQDGAVIGNAWAFLPAYPLLVTALTLGHGSLWTVVAVSVSGTCGMIAALLLAELVRRNAGDRPALVAAVLFSFGPSAYVLQTAYAESMGLMLLFLLLLLIDQRRYWTATGAAVALALTRPGMQAVALLVGLHLLVRIWRARARGDALERREAGAIVVLGAISCALGFVWPFIAGVVTGRRDAYIATELAWRTPYTGSSELGFFTPWVIAFQGLFGAGGVLVLVAILIAAALFLFSRSVRGLGSTIGLFAASWCFYLLAIFYPQSSTWRLLLPVAPLGGALPLTSRSRLLAGASIGVALQGWLLWNGYGAVHGQYSPP